MDSPITKKSRGSRPPFGMPIFIIILQKNEKIKLHLGYKSGFLLTNVAFRLQKLRFVYKYSVVNLQNCVSAYKVASRLSIKQRENKQGKIYEKMKSNMNININTCLYR